MSSSRVPRRLLEQLQRCRQQWGQPPEGDRDWKTRRTFHRRAPLPEGCTPADMIDEQTWSELNLGDVYAQFDRTLSTPGACTLYRMLRTAVAPLAAWRQRRGLITLFENDAPVRESVQAALLETGTRGGAELTALLWEELPQAPDYAWMFRVLPLALLASLVLFILTLSLPWFLILIFLVVADARVHYREQARLEGRLGALHRLRHLIVAADRAGGLDHPDLAAYAQPLREHARSAHRLRRRLGWLLPEFSSAAMGDVSGLLLDYLDMLLLHQVRSFYASLADIRAQHTGLREMFRLLGELDACQAVANWRAGTEGWVEPEIGAGLTLEMIDARHPLVENAVANTLHLDTPGIAVTGSNMSGKTTFLRTVAVNAVLAQTVATCLAASYHGPMLRILTSMNCGDNLLEGKSYYLAEAERLLAIVRATDGERPLLALIDEPLAGTNSPERHAASREILRYLAGHNAVVLASTHDVELVRALEEGGRFTAYHFSDSADAQGLSFDYKLHPGLDYHANALAVLRYLGFPDAIVQAAAAPESLSQAGRGRGGADQREASGAEPPREAGRACPAPGK